MPTYEYECERCRRVFEVRQRISAEPLATCEACGGTVRRLLSPAPFILKGGGWHVTDYPSEARKKAVESEKGAEKGAEKAEKKDTPSGEKSSTSPAAATTSSAPAPSSTKSSD